MNLSLYSPPTKTKDYHIYTNDDNNDILIIGRNQSGNDYIIDNAPQIVSNLLNTEVTANDLIWLHGAGPSPHFIFYSKTYDCVNTLELENFVKSKCPAKSDKSLSLHCCLLSDVKKTEVKGMVQIIVLKLGIVIDKILKAQKKQKK